MKSETFGRLVTVKTLIRVVMTALSLNGMAHAASPGNASPQQSGNAYNFMAGGGG